MTKYLLNILDGARMVLVLRPNADYVRPSRHDTRRDKAMLAGDARRVAVDMRRALDHGKQVNYR